MTTETVQKRPRGRPRKNECETKSNGVKQSSKKYKTEEERREATLDIKSKYYDRNRQRIKEMAQKQYYTHAKKRKEQCMQLLTKIKQNLQDKTITNDNKLNYLDNLVPEIDEMIFHFSPKRRHFGKRTKSNSQNQTSKS